jgi:hypothetical protein
LSIKVSSNRDQVKIALWPRNEWDGYKEVLGRRRKIQAVIDWYPSSCCSPRRPLRRLLCCCKWEEEEESVANNHSPAVFANIYPDPDPCNPLPALPGEYEEEYSEFESVLKLI